MATRIIDKESHIVLFNTNTGEFERETIRKEMRPSGPDLLDISITNKCSLGCDICYKKSTPHGKHMSFCDLKSVILQAKDLGVVQIAFGGGNPNEHPNFVEILQYTRNHDIIPNFTTNGYNLLNEHFLAAKDYCGAVGLSLYDDIEHFKKVLVKFHDLGVRVNAHIVLQGGRTNQILSRLKSISNEITKLNAVIFLNYKPINKTIKFIKLTDKEFKNIYESCVELGFEKIGFDSCLSSYVSRILKQERYTFCDSAMYSAYISEELDVSPCSFVAKQISLSLRKMTLKDIWFSSMFEKFISTEINEECRTCEMVELCKGGCKYFDINYCF